MCVGHARMDVQRHIQLIGIVENFGQFDICLVDIKAGEGVHREYSLDDGFFDAMSSPVLGRGKLTALVDVRRQQKDYTMRIACEGFVVCPCDRCLGDVEVEVNVQEDFIVALGQGDADEVVYVDNAEGTLNVAWTIFETIAVSLPCKCVHANGGCDEAMMAKLSEHAVDGQGKGGAGNWHKAESDPRWDELKKLLDNNK